MGLSDFEREIAEEKSVHHSKHESRGEDGERKHRHHHHHHHRSHRHRNGSRERDGEHRHKRHRDRRDEEDDEERRRRRKRRRSSEKAAPKPEAKREVEVEEIKVFDSDNNDDEDEWVEKGTDTAPPEEDILDQRDVNLRDEKVQRDAWMQEPSSLDVDYVQSRKPESAPKSQFVGARENHEFKLHTAEVSSHLKDLERDFDDSGDDDDENGVVVQDEPAQHEVGYTFGDAGSAWRMTKLRAVYRLADESGRSVEEAAMGKYGDLRLFDNAREEEREMERRRMYGKEYVGLEKPSGELYQERKMRAGIYRDSQTAESKDEANLPPQGTILAQNSVPSHKVSTPLDTAALNKLKAQLLKAKLRNSPNVAELEKQYNAAVADASMTKAEQSDVVVLNTSTCGNEVTASGTGRRARERGLVKENEDMTIEDMVRAERRSARGGGSGRELADRIAKDGKFIDDLDYMDDNAEKLSKKVIKTDSQLRSTAIEDFTKMKKALDSCPLCHREDATTPSDQLPVAPVVSLATRTYLTLPTEPEILKNGGGAVIVPIQHHPNLLSCDEDEWEEMRNFMKSLTRFYDSQGKGVIFYENAAHSHSKRGHAALNAVPLPRHLVDNAPAYFKEAILASDEQWSQHKPIIDTLALSQKPGYGKAAFRKSLPKEMSYFHVWFTLDGGMGHVVEDERRWPNGDLFAREVVGGMLGVDLDKIKRQGRWERHDRRVEAFRKGWGKWDWTRALVQS